MKRISHVYRRLHKGGSFIDVGLGAGQFVNLVAHEALNRKALTVAGRR